VYLTRAFSKTAIHQTNKLSSILSDGTYQITKVNDKHEGHGLNEELFKHLPRQKRLTMMKEMQF